MAWLDAPRGVLDRFGMMLALVLMLVLLPVLEFSRAMSAKSANADILGSGRRDQELIVVLLPPD